MKRIKTYTERKTMLYKTGVEYGDYTMNHMLGCSHGCKYPCYAYLMARRFGRVNSFESWLEPTLVANTLDLLDKEIPRLKSKIQSVHLCFTSDPFMYEFDEIEEMSIAAIRKLNDAGIKCTVLTKGILPSSLAKLSRENEYGITLVSLDEDFRMQAEPGTASFNDRVAALKDLHNLGCKTWVSMEPYPTPNLMDQDLDEILEMISFADKIIFGRTNYNKEVSSYANHKLFFNEQAHRVIEFCDMRGIAYHIKEGTIRETGGCHDEL
jgi:DNA repair photolyase